MPKPIIKIRQTDNEALIQNLNIESKQKFKSPQFAFRKKRSSDYVKKLKKLDIMGYSISASEIEEIINAIKNELPEINVEDLPIGIVAKCYLGEPYEVHTLSLFGLSIVKHYKAGESLPSELEKARNLANNDKYAFIEVYHTKIIAVKEDGTTAIIEN